ncbi:MAG: hypothetical protein Q3979_00245 [Actinomycetaceae bacterium]|nr:hypothetical protein [Actinomycetaceae bacterium]
MTRHTTSARWRAVLAGLALACAGLAGCGNDTPESCQVKAYGDLGAPVTVDVDCPEGAGKLTKEVVTKGEGEKIEAGQVVVMRATSFDSRNGKLIESYGTGQMRIAEVSEKGMGELADLVVGARQGSRLIIKRPGLQNGVPTASEIVVVDLVPTTAEGSEAPPRDPVPVGMPSLETKADGTPEVTAPGGAIPESSVVPTILGSGGQVSEGQTLAVQYAMYDEEGNLLDTTWEDRKPAALDLNEGMEGLAKGLVDQRVGSRVVVLIPSAAAQGTGGRVVIVDILGIMSDSPSDSSSQSSGASPSATPSPSATSATSAGSPSTGETTATSESTSIDSPASGGASNSPSDGGAPTSP